MAQKKITQLDELLIPAPEDLIPVVDDVTGTPVTKKMQLGNWPRLQDYQRVVVVDQGGKGDFTTIKEACDWVATQTRSTVSNWTIIVMPGRYIEEAFTIPSFTTLMGISNMSSVHTEATYLVMIDISNITSGNAITMEGNSKLSGFIVYQSSTPTLEGNLTIIYSNGSSCSVERIQTYSTKSTSTYTLRHMHVPTGKSMSIGYSVINAYASTANDAANLIGIESAGTLNLARSYIFPAIPTGEFGIGLKITGGTNLVYYSGFLKQSTVGWGTYDIQVTGGTLTVQNSTFRKYSGVMQDAFRFKATATGIHEAIGATDIPLTIKGAADQTADLMQSQNSNGDVLFGIAADGNLKTAKSAAASTLGTVVKKLEIFDAAGNSLGFIPIYDSIE
jgi:hypothetical protein